MRLAILSGKGGTGKTFISVNIAAVMENSTYIDCDVEEPNGRLFFKPEISSEKSVNVRIPHFSEENCIGCKECVEFCAFNALAFVRGKPMLFPEVCHSCGGCSIVCQHGAVKETEKEVGKVLTGTSGKVKFMSGIMNIKEASGVPIIKELLKNIPVDTNVIIDCPPGSGCMVMESIKDADYCVIVSEPTEFGRDNLQMVYELVKVFGKKLGVVLNKCSETKNPSKDFCIKNRIDILSEIPFDKKIGEENSRGEIVVYKNENVKTIFMKLLKEIQRRVHV